MIKVKMCFSLTGKTDAWKRLMKGSMIEWTNTDTFDYVKDVVSEYFGRRALVIMNESMLKSGMINYPRYFAAGWFCDESLMPSELVVVAHGNTMEEANKTMIASVKNIDWANLAVKV
jgi:hypothetical protein